LDFGIDIIIIMGAFGGFLNTLHNFDTKENENKKRSSGINIFF
jgi:hypothetical protein